MISVYNLDILNEFMKRKFENDEQIRDYAFNQLSVKCHLLIRAHIESVKYLIIPKDLKPKIILSTASR